MKIDLHTSWVILRRGDEILLGMKKRGFGKSKLTGIGGKQENNESITACAIRETKEEIGTKIRKFQDMGQIIFDNLYYHNRPIRNMMHLFVATEWEGEIKESEEEKPQWCKITELNYDEMWCDNRHWLPQVLDGQAIEAYFHFLPDQTFDDFWVEIQPKRRIATIRDSNLGFEDVTPTEEANFYLRRAARAVLYDENYRIALLYAKNANYYKLAGGGIEDDELIAEAMHREVREEAGYQVEITEALGNVLETRAKFRQHNLSYAYLAKIKEFVGTELMLDEIKDGFELVWFENIDSAIKAVKKITNTTLDYRAKFFSARELTFLRAAKKSLAEKI